MGWVGNWVTPSHPRKITNFPQNFWTPSLMIYHICKHCEVKFRWKVATIQTLSWSVRHSRSVWRTVWAASTSTPSSAPTAPSSTSSTSSATSGSTWTAPRRNLFTSSTMRSMQSGRRTWVLCSLAFLQEEQEEESQCSKQVQEVQEEE